MAQPRFPGWPTVARHLGRYGLTDAEAASLRGQIAAFRTAQARVRLVLPRRSAPPPASPWSPPPRREPSRKSWVTHGTGKCPLGCPRKLPHRTPEDIKTHYRAMGWRQNGRIWRQTAWARANIQVLVRGRIEVWRQRRVAVFREEAPHAYQPLGAAAVYEIVTTQFRHRHTYARQRRWVQIHYGGQPSRQPEAMQRGWKQYDATRRGGDRP